MTIKDVIAIKEVKSDLDKGEPFYESQAFGIGLYFRDSIISDIESLRLYAEIHSKHLGLYRMLSARFPYAIYYEILGTIAIVIAVLDMRKNHLWYVINYEIENVNKIGMTGKYDFHAQMGNGESISRAIIGLKCNNCNEEVSVYTIPLNESID